MTINLHNYKGGKLEVLFHNVGVNVDVNINKNERQIIELILNDPYLTAEKISIKINKTKRTAERYLKT